MCSTTHFDRQCRSWVRSVIFRCSGPTSALPPNRTSPRPRSSAECHEQTCSCAAAVNASCQSRIPAPPQKEAANLGGLTRLHGNCMRLPGTLDQEVLIEELSLSIGKWLVAGDADHGLGRFSQGFHAREAVFCSTFGAQEKHRSIHGISPWTARGSRSCLSLIKAGRA